MIQKTSAEHSQTTRGDSDFDNGSHLEAIARAELRKSSYFALRRITCEVNDCVLTLRGSVPSYYMKQMAQAAINHRLEGMVVIENRLEVT